MVLAIIAASTKGNAKWAMIQLSCLLLLWLYSAYFKRWLLVGNLAVAVLTALVIFIILLYQPITVVPLTISPLTIGVGYALFAFMTTWLRELVKDMEDAPGDATYGCTTLPVKYGIEVSAIFASALVVGIVLALGFAAVQLFLLHYYYLGGYIVLLLLAPLSVWLVFFRKNNTPEHYHKAASWLKVIMLPGICSLIVYYLETQHLLCAR
jgi:4-hydroxybenzoate polyprenyltransferase